MAIAPYRPSTDLFRPLLEEFFSPGNGGRNGNLMRPPVADVVETEHDIRVELEVPGMDASELQVDIENNVLSISGDKREERKESDERSTWHLAERRYGQFSRSFVLPREVDADRISAVFENGVLTVTIPKSERAKRRRIEVIGDGSRRVETAVG